MSEIEEHGLTLNDLTLEQLIELRCKERFYGVAFAIKYEDGRIEIKGLTEFND